MQKTGNNNTANIFFQNNDLAKEKDYTTAFEAFNSDAFNGWGYPKTELKRENLLVELRKKIWKCCKSKNK